MQKVLYKHINSWIPAQSMKGLGQADFLGIKCAKWGKNGLKCSMKFKLFNKYFYLQIPAGLLEL
jgi:hypothetical protein